MCLNPLRFHLDEESQMLDNQAKLTPSIYVNLASFFFLVRPVLFYFLISEEWPKKALFHPSTWDLIVKYDIFFLLIAVIVTSNFIHEGITNRERIQRVFALPSIIFLSIYGVLAIVITISSRISLLGLFDILQIFGEVALLLLIPTASMILAVESFYNSLKSTLSQTLLLSTITIFAYFLGEKITTPQYPLFHFLHYLPFGYLSWPIFRYAISKVYKTVRIHSTS